MDTTTYVDVMTYLGLPPVIRSKMIEFVSIIASEKPQVNIEDMGKYTRSQYKKKITKNDLPDHIPEGVDVKLPKKKDKTHVGYDGVSLIGKKDVYITSSAVILGLVNVEWGDGYAYERSYVSKKHISESVVEVLDVTSKFLSKEDVMRIVGMVEFADDVFTQRKNLSEETYDDYAIPYLVVLLIIKQSYTSSRLDGYHRLKKFFEEAVRYVRTNSLFLQLSLRKDPFSREGVHIATPSVPPPKTPKFAFKTDAEVEILISEEDIVEEIHISSDEEEGELWGAIEEEYVSSDEVVYVPACSSSSSLFSVDDIYVEESCPED